MDLNPTPIAPMLPYPALAQKNEIVDLTNVSETEHIDLTDDIPTIPIPPKTPINIHQEKIKSQRPDKVLPALKSMSHLHHPHQQRKKCSEAKSLGSKITKKKVIKRESSVSSTSSLEINASNVLNEETLRNYRSVSPEPRVSCISLPSYTLHQQSSDPPRLTTYYLRARQLESSSHG